jgi:hypothetical protein
MSVLYTTTLEAGVLGRNDDYEPGWRARLEASLLYNRKLFEGTRVDFRVAFVEWNPPVGRQLLAPDLIATFPFVRAIVVDREVHEYYCESDDLQVLLNFGLNPAIRTSSSDFFLITGGDIFMGRELANRIVAEGLVPGCLYRAERVNVRRDLPFESITGETLEADENVVSVDSCAQPPYNVPPFTHACGDFILLDTVSMLGIRGFDEGIRFARLHLDSRCCLTAMAAGLNCELLGRIYHVDHARSYVNQGSSYPGRIYNPQAGMPYLNPPTWGLADMHWERLDSRMWRVRLPSLSSPAEPGRMPSGITPENLDRVNSVTKRLLLAKCAAHPTELTESAFELECQIPVTGLSSQSHWSGARIEAGATPRITTPAQAWAYAAALPLDLVGRLLPSKWYWIRLGLRVLSGVAAVGLWLVSRDQILHEALLQPEQSLQEVLIPLLAERDAAILFRTGSSWERCSIEVLDAAIVSQYKPDASNVLLRPTDVSTAETLLPVAP